MLRQRLGPCGAELPASDSAARTLTPQNDVCLQGGALHLGRLPLPGSLPRRLERYHEQTRRQYGDGWRAQHRHHAQLDAHREQDPDWVEARTRSHV
jgi:hypothetical protein